MAEIRWTQQAADDFEAVVAFIADDSEHYAQMLAWEILQKIERLILFPFSGRVVPEINVSNIREVIFGNYRIIYRATEDMVEILTIFHCARHFDLEL